MINAGSRIQLGDVALVGVLVDVIAGVLARELDLVAVGVFAGEVGEEGVSPGVDV